MAQQYAEDITAFPMWAAEPKLEEREKIGFSVIISRSLASSSPCFSIS
jgi:cytochrome c1